MAVDLSVALPVAPPITLQPRPSPEVPARSLGPLKTVHAFWLSGMSCDGCTIGISGATNPSVEQLLTGVIPGVPQIVLHHTVLAVEAGRDFVAAYEQAARGELDAPYVVLYEGSIADERIAGAAGGYWSAMGVEIVDGEHRPVPTSTWLKRLAPRAAAVIAVGTCATWGGIPAAANNPTGAMSVVDLLGADYRSTFGLPVVNIPGCSPIGDNLTETIAAVLLFLQGLGPLPEFDELGRPAWLFGDTVHRGCSRAGFYEEGVFAGKYGDRECLVEMGCWGPVVQCNIARRGAIGHMGGCMNVGGICIGCTMPGFPDRFAPFYQTPPGSTASSNASRAYGLIIRRLRQTTQRHHNLTPRWEKEQRVPSGWGHVPQPSFFDRLTHYFYERLQFTNSPKPGSRK